VAHPKPKTKDEVLCYPERVRHLRNGNERKKITGGMLWF
jgi:hypothetical protein